MLSVLHDQDSLGILAHVRGLHVAALKTETT
jgi:hypothetical protein